MKKGKQSYKIPKNGKEIEWIDINILKEAPYNSRIHSDEQIELLKKLLKFYGWTRPCIVQRSTNYVLAGNGIFRAAKESGLDKALIRYKDFNNTEAMAYCIADNKSSEISKWDYPKLKDLVTEIDTGAIDIEIMGFDEVELKEVFDYESSHQKQVSTRSKDDEFLILSFVVNKKEKAFIEKQLIKIADKNSFNDNSNTQALLWLLEKQK